MSRPVDASDVPRSRADVLVPLPAGRLASLVERVHGLLSGFDSLGVAFSSGVDSTVLLALAIRTLGRERVVALVGVSPSLARAELAEARELAAALDVRLLEVNTNEGSRPLYRVNGPDRCYHCKDELFGQIERVHQEFSAVAYGETADDRGRADRPGADAATEHGVLAPLADAGFTKLDVRELAWTFGLPNWNKPAAPCLASRIPHFTEVTPAKLHQIETAEAALRSFGLVDLRVRHHGDLARIEVPEGELERVSRQPLRDLVRSAVESAGFSHVTVDLAGLRSGHLFQIATA